MQLNRCICKNFKFNNHNEDVFIFYLLLLGLEVSWSAIDRAGRLLLRAER